jgi:hypothetical protein
MLEVGRDLRLSMFPEIVRAAADGVPDRRQLACYQRRILHAAYSHCHIEPFSDQIRVPVSEKRKSDDFKQLRYRDHASPHELADGVAHVHIVPAKAIDPTDHKRITGPRGLSRTRVILKA